MVVTEDFFMLSVWRALLGRFDWEAQRVSEFLGLH